MTGRCEIINAENGIEVFDFTMLCHNRVAALDALEERYRREEERRKLIAWKIDVERKRRIARNPLLKFAAACGLY